jgi:ribosomal protein S18 acetylase RimI-like enzyme
MKFLAINQENISYLDDFIKTIGSSSTSFRYYDSRDTSIIKNHIMTFVLHDDGLVGYGHLDKEDNKVWLGICVKEGCHGRGYGKKIMKKLVDYDGDIYLSVDAINARAIRLYQLFQFKEINRTEKIVYMKREVNAPI